VVIFQHELTFLQSESLQTHVGTIHRPAIGPLAHYNSTSAYSPSLTCTNPTQLTQPKPTQLTQRSTVFTVHGINSRASLAISRYELSLPTKRESVAKHTRTSTLGDFQTRLTKSVEVRRQQSLDHRNVSVSIVACVTMLLIGPPFELLRC
jgi:hypothetical protein